MKIKLVLATLLLTCSAFSVAQELSIERIMSAPSLTGTAPSQVKLSPDGERVTFIRAKTTDTTRFDLWEYHIPSGEERILFDADDLHTGPETLSDEEKARRERLRLSGSGIVSYHWSKDGKALIFPLAGDVYYYRLGDKSATRLVETPEFETDVKLSPQGNYISYIREQNLYVLEIATGKETPITKRGGGAIKFGMAEFVAQEEMSRMTGYWWAPDESAIAFTRTDESGVKDATRSEIYADHIDMIDQKYPFAGTDNALIELYVQTLSDTRRTQVPLGAEQDMYLPRVNWMPNSQALTYQWQSRDQKSLELRAFDLTKRQTHVLLTETSPTWINLHKSCVFSHNLTNLFGRVSVMDSSIYIYIAIMAS